MKLRTVVNVVLSRWQSEGRGARVRRSIGRTELRYLGRRERIKWGVIFTLSDESDSYFFNLSSIQSEIRTDVL